MRLDPKQTIGYNFDELISFTPFTVPVLAIDHNHNQRKLSN